MSTEQERQDADNQLAQGLGYPTPQPPIEDRTPQGDTK
jgi:hypothetical protein